MWLAYVVADKVQKVPGRNSYRVPSSLGHSCIGLVHSLMDVDKRIHHSLSVGGRPRQVWAGSREVVWRNVL